MSRFVSSLALVGFMALAAPACGPRPPAESAQPAAQQEDAAPVTVQVMNNNIHPVELYLDTGAGQKRISAVRGLGRSTFEIPWRAMTGSKSIRLAAREVGGGGRVVPSGSVDVAPGGKVAWTVEANLVFSTVSAY